MARKLVRLLRPERPGWQARNRMHMVLIKLVLFTGLRKEGNELLIGQQQIIRAYAASAGIEKRVYPHLLPS